MDRRVFLAFLAAAPFVAACATAPYTGRNQLMLLSVDQEMALGLDAAKEILREEPESHDPLYVRPTREVGGRIAAVANEPRFQWEFHVIDKPDTVNAFCLPGGKVFVYTGLFSMARNPPELAAVIAHEAAHAIARHGAERMSTSLLAELTQSAAQVAIANQEPLAQEIFNVAFGVGATYGVILPFSRQQEYEADHIGLILMAKAGYHPEAALRFWERMARKDSKDKAPEYLSTHPSDENRVAAIRQLLPEAMRYYRPQ